MREHEVHLQLHDVTLSVPECFAVLFITLQVVALTLSPWPYIHLGRPLTLVYRENPLLRTSDNREKGSTIKLSENDFTFLLNRTRGTYRKKYLLFIFVSQLPPFAS